MSAQLQAPTDQEAVVALNRNASVSYGTQPYGPGTNTAYDLVRQTVVDLHAGPSNNPLAGLVRQLFGDQHGRPLLKGLDQGVIGRDARAIGAIEHLAYGRFRAEVMLRLVAEESRGLGDLHHPDERLEGVVQQGVELED
jgi:hypothetical protein